MRGPPLLWWLLLPLVAAATVGAFAFPWPWPGNEGPTLRDAEAVVHKVRAAAPMLFMGPEELAEAQGFGLEAHTVRTEDGYLLTLHRLAPPAPAGDEGDRGEPVLLVHGIFCASDLWLLTPRDHALAFLLADKGYDVWLANLRGNPYSRRHESLSTQDLAFWNFSWHEMGVYDIPACMDYILKATRREQLYYVGHSMGNAAYYAMAASRPDVGARVRLHVGLAPAVFMSHIPSQVARVVARKGAAIVVTGAGGLAQAGDAACVGRAHRAALPLVPARRLARALPAHLRNDLRPRAFRLQRVAGPVLRGALTAELFGAHARPLRAARSLRALPAVGRGQRGGQPAALRPPRAARLRHQPHLRALRHLLLRRRLRRRRHGRGASNQSAEERCVSVQSARSPLQPHGLPLDPECRPDAVRSHIQITCSVLTHTSSDQE